MFSRVAMLLWIVVCCAASAHAQIISQKEYPAYQLIELDVEPTAATYRSVIWQFTPPTISGHQCADGKMLFVAPPGSYSVVASVVAGTKDADKITIVEGDHKLWSAEFHRSRTPMMATLIHRRQSPIRLSSKAQSC